jgi:transcriptional regulator with XRE-family HTH domain
MRGHLIDARRQRGLTQKALSDLSGVAQNTISRAESGLTIPRGDALARLCRALDLDPVTALEIVPPTTEHQAKRPASEAA